MESLKNYLKSCKSDYGNYKSPNDCLEKKTRKRINRRTYFGRWYGGAGHSHGTGGPGSGPGAGTGGGMGAGDGSGGGAAGGPGGGGGAAGGGE